jgi:hypothetical protein
MNPDKIIDLNEWLQVIRQRVESLNYGSVEITIHDSKIVELDTTRRFRLNQGGEPGSQREKEKPSRFQTVPSRAKHTNSEHPR